MNTYLINTTKVTPEGSNLVQAKEFHEEDLFKPLRALASGLNGQLIIVNEMKLIGVVVVEASDEVVKTLKNAGYQVHVNGKVRAL